jgi:hypothetical protein
LIQFTTALVLLESFRLGGLFLSFAPVAFAAELESFVLFLSCGFFFQSSFGFLALFSALILSALLELFGFLF